MSNFAAQLKSEIQRLCRKEIRAETASLRKSTTTYRAEIAALKRRVSVLESALKKLGRTTAAKPRSLQLAAIARVRKLGKRAAAEALAAL